MINQEDCEFIVEAARNVALLSIDMKELNDVIAGESTRIMNLYSQYINMKSEQNNYKNVYDKSKSVMIQCNKIDKMIAQLKNHIQDLLNELSGIYE